jgi:hypothetical protein
VHQYRRAAPRRPFRVPLSALYLGDACAFRFLRQPSKAKAPRPHQRLCASAGRVPHSVALTPGIHWETVATRGIGNRRCRGTSSSARTATTRTAATRTAARRRAARSTARRRARRRTDVAAIRGVLSAGLTCRVSGRLGGYRRRRQQKRNKGHELHVNLAYQPLRRCDSGVAPLSRL